MAKHSEVLLAPVENQSIQFFCFIRFIGAFVETCNTNGTEKKIHTKF